MFGWLFGRKEKAAAGGEVGGGEEMIILDRVVPLAPDRAFDLFVSRIGEWWPRQYAFHPDRLDAIAIEPRMQGRLTERAKDGSETQWGTVLVYSPPDHFVFTWQITPDRRPEPSPDQASRVDVRFSAEGENGSRILVVHRDFPRHGDGWRDYRKRMASKDGWPTLLDAYLKAAG